jgi:hypothetical protein
MATTPYDDVATPRGRAGTARPVARPRRAPLPLAAAVAAAWAAVTSYGLVLALVAAGGATAGVPATGVLRFALTGWLLGHGVPVSAPGDRVSLVPLALSAFAAWRVARAGVHACRAADGHRRRSPGRALGAAGAVAMSYAGLGVAAAALVPGGTVPVVRAGVTLFCFGAVAAGWGVFRHAPATRRLRDRVPVVVRDAVRTGLAAAVLLLAAGAVLAGAALAARGGDAAAVLGGYRTGVLGQAGITVLCLAYAPNVAIWGAAYLLGPGFSVGVDTIVSPGEVMLVELPAVPVLAGLPGGPYPGVAPALLGLALAAAAWSGWTLTRHRQVTGPAGGWGRALGAAVLSGPVAGLALLAAAHASAGALGSGRLAAIGPSAWPVCVQGTVVVTAGALLGVVLARGLPRRRPTGPAGAD